MSIATSLFGGRLTGSRLTVAVVPINATFSASMLRRRVGTKAARARTPASPKALLVEGLVLFIGAGCFEGPNRRLGWRLRITVVLFPAFADILPPREAIGLAMLHDEIGKAKMQLTVKVVESDRHKDRLRTTR